MRHLQLCSEVLYALNDLTSSAQYHRAAKHKNLLSMKFLLGSKQDY